ncbi:MAG: hypothetical protein M5U28_10315 [Sandaracinaceae bacterium]|nr:hypothetical protein [Sandaracinaceae bacterium]
MRRKIVGALVALLGACLASTAMAQQTWVGGSPAQGRVLVDANGDTWVGIWIDAPATVHQPRARAPMAISLVVDTSGSMAGDKIQNARMAAASLLESLRDGDIVSIYGFQLGRERDRRADRALAGHARLLDAAHLAAPSGGRHEHVGRHAGRRLAHVAGARHAPAAPHLPHLGRPREHRPLRPDLARQPRRGRDGVRHPDHRDRRRLRLRPGHARRARGAQLGPPLPPRAVAPDGGHPRAGAQHDVQLGGAERVHRGRAGAGRAHRRGRHHRPR